MEYPEIRCDTLADVAAFVMFFIVADMFSTVLVLAHYGPAVIAYEINVFAHLQGINGLAAMKIGVMIFALGMLVVFSRYQASIGDILLGLAVAGALCAVSNLYFICHGSAPAFGHIGIPFLAGVAINVAFLKAIADAHVGIMKIRIRSI